MNGPLNQPAIFWGELSPCKHPVQIYEQDHKFLRALEEFVSVGLQSAEAVVVVATENHRTALEKQLTKRGINLSDARAQDQYIDLDAGAMLSKFMVQGWPDATLFKEMITDLMERVCINSRPVRVFGEMVALLWAEGNNAATIRLERLWHTLCMNQGFSLYCAYPKNGFTQDADVSIREICALHSKICLGS